MNDSVGHFAKYHRDNMMNSDGFDTTLINLTFLFILLVLTAFCASNVKAAEVDWGQVEAKTIKTFYPVILEILFRS